MKGIEYLFRHRNPLLLILLIMTLMISGFVSHKRLKTAPAAVTIPVIATAREVRTALESFRMDRDARTKADIASLEKLCAAPSLDDSMLESAAAQLQEIIGARQTEAALEGALSGSSLSPCTAVLSGGSLTIITEKEQITDKDTVLVLTLADAHTDVLPENVRIITADAP